VTAVKHEIETWSRIERIIEHDGRFRANAYSFVLAAVEYVITRLPAARHISGRELCEGIKELALQEYGPMAKEVFNFWGVQTTEDFGRIVFNLVEADLLSRTDEDSIEDFFDIYDFKQAFEEDYYNR
jgi:uncharacterized repeat protein (TIGR04138 family)